MARNLSIFLKNHNPLLRGEGADELERVYE